MNQVNGDLYLNQGDHQVIIGSHARERIAERLQWSKKEYKKAISETCLDFWNDLIDENIEWFQIIHKGVKWIFETRGMNRVVLMTVIPCNKHPNHEKIRELIRILCSTGEENRRQKLKNEICELNNLTPKLAICRDCENRVSYFSFDV